MIPIHQQAAEITQVEQITPEIFRFTLLAPEIGGSASPGQFVMVQVEDEYDPLSRRPFSIHQVLPQGELQVLFKNVGYGTRKLSALRSGDKVNILGPLGHGYELPDSGRVCLVGGGMGIAPLPFLARRFLKDAPAVELQVLLGARTREELLALAEEMEAMGLKVRTATDDGTLGHHGLVVDLMDRLDRNEPWHVMTCGPHPMMRAVVSRCTEANWRCQVSLETMMACGVAACLGCATPKPDDDGYVHVCKDGPVFYAEDVAWR